MKHIQTFESVNEIRTSMISGTSGRTIDSLEDRKYELKKDVKGAQIGDFVNVTLPKGTIIYNLPGGVFADHFSLKNKYASKSSRGPQYFEKPTFSGIMIKQKPDTLAAIEKNSKVLESVSEGIFDRFKKKGWDIDPGDEGWFDPIAKEALAQLQKHHKWKDMELAAMGPGDSKTYMNMAITTKKHNRGAEHEFKVHFDKNDKVTKIEPLEYGHFESVDEGKNSAVWTSPKTGKSYDIQKNGNRWEMDILKKGSSIYDKVTTLKRKTPQELKDWLDEYKIDSQWMEHLI